MNRTGIGQRALILAALGCALGPLDIRPLPPEPKAPPAPPVPPPQVISPRLAAANAKRARKRMRRLQQHRGGGDGR